MTTRFALAMISAAALGAAACAAPRAAEAPTPVTDPAVPAPPPILTPAPLPPANPALPPVPHVTGPLLIKVIYPNPGQQIQSRDSNFVFGSVGNGDAALAVNGIATPVWPNGAFMAWLPNPPASSPQYEIVARTATDSATLVLPIKLRAEPAPTPPPTEPARPDTVPLMTAAQYAALMGPAAYASDTERVVTGYTTRYPTSGGLERWFLLPGTVVKVERTVGNYAYVRLDTSQTIVIDKAELKIDSAAKPVGRVASQFTVQSEGEWTDIAIPVTATPAFLVETGPSALTLTLYETRAGPGGSQFYQPPGDSYLTSVISAQQGERLQYMIGLKGPTYGYQPLWENGKFILRVRRPPSVDAAAPLRGLTIAVDPGHPPVGATGPTGLYEAEATLAVGLKVRDLLQAKGVNVLMTRSTPEPVDLNLRSTLGRRANSHAFVSIHLNAVGDGNNPFRAQGTETYHYHLHAAPLAKAVQNASVAQLGLKDNGVKRSNFAVVRSPWMPSILVEGLFIIMPDQEAAIRTPEYQGRYAQGIVDGLESYFRSLAPVAR